MKPNFNSQADAVIRLYTGEGIYSPETLIDICAKFIKQGREFIKENKIPKWFLSELYAYLKKSGSLPDLPRERKLELWNEAVKDKLLYLALYLIEII